MVKPCCSTDRRCPVCAGANHCRVADGSLYKGPCWCEEASVPSPVLRFLVESQLEAACLCRRCLGLLAEHARRLNDPAQILARVRAEIQGATDPADFYLEAGGRMVFTAHYHLKRGSCCGSGCRHCPYPGTSLLDEPLR